MIESLAKDEGADAALAAFRALVFGDLALQARLGAIEIPDLFVDEAMRVARDHGIALSDEAVRTALRPDPLGISRFVPSPVTLERWPPRHWLPVRTVPTGGAPACDWIWFGERPLDHPFYDDSVRRFAARPLNLMFRSRTSAASLVAGVDAADGPAPSGFIHHMSRCGSTLVAQMLAADPSHIVLSEAEPLDGVVRWAMESGAPLQDQIAALRAIVAALGRDRAGNARRVFFKLDSWHVLALPLFRAAFPETPWAFVYRNPVEVLVSQERERGIHTVAGLLPVSIVDIPGTEGMAANRYAALVLNRMCEAVLDHWTIGGGLLIDYGELPDAVIERIAPHFGFVPTGDERAAMAEAATRDAKAPGRAFVPDATRKRAAATTEINAVARALVEPAYIALESLRRRCLSDTA